MHKLLLCRTDYIAESVKLRLWHLDAHSGGGHEVGAPTIGHGHLVLPTVADPLHRQAALQHGYWAGSLLAAERSCWIARLAEFEPMFRGMLNGRWFALEVMYLVSDHLWQKMTSRFFAALRDRSRGATGLSWQRIASRPARHFCASLDLVSFSSITARHMLDNIREKIRRDCSSPT